MIDTWQASVIATLGDGAVYHVGCIEDKGRSYRPHRNDDGTYTLESEGLEPLSRYAIHEWESSNWSDAVYSGDVAEGDDDYDGPYIWVTCDECGKRIE